MKNSVSLQDAIDALKAAIETADAEAQALVKEPNMNDMFIRYQKFKEEYAELDALRKRVYHMVDNMDKRAIPARFEEVGFDSKIRVPELSKSFYVLPKHSTKVLDKQAMREWVVANGGEDLYTEVINAGTLTKFLRERLEEDGIEPEPTVAEFNTYHTISSSKYTPK